MARQATGIRTYRYLIPAVFKMFSTLNLLKWHILFVNVEINRSHVLCGQYLSVQRSIILRVEEGGAQTWSFISNLVPRKMLHGVNLYHCLGECDIMIAYWQQWDGLLGSAASLHNKHFSVGTAMLSSPFATVMLYFFLDGQHCDQTSKRNTAFHPLSNQWDGELPGTG
jgi:hypothetical protein